MKPLFLVILAVLLWSSTPCQADIWSGPDDSFLWNRFNSVDVLDTLALATTDYGVALLKVNEVTEHFDLVGQLLLGTAACEAKFAGQTAIIRGCAGLVYFVDLSDLPDLHLVGEIDLDLAVHDLTLIGDDLYVACGFDGLRHYSLADFAQPQFVDSSLAGVHCVQVEARDGELLLLDDYNGILRFDLADRGIKDVENVLYLPRRALSFQYLDDTLFIPLVGRSEIYRGVLNSATAQLIDSVSLQLTPEAVFIADSLIVGLDMTRDLLELVSTGSGGHLLVDLDEAFDLEPIGDLYKWQNTPYLLLISNVNSLACYNLQNLWFDDSPRQAYGRPGPVRALAFHQGRLATGGSRNPLEVYQLDQFGQPALDTALYGLNNIGGLSDAGEVLLAHYPGVSLITSIRMGGDSIQTLGSAATSSGHVQALRFYEYPPVDTASLVLAISHAGVEIISVSPTWELERTDIARTLEDILDAIVVDSFLLVSTTDRQVHTFKLFSDFRAVLWWSVSAPVSLNHLTPTGPRQAHEGWWYPDMLLGFGGNEMYEIFLTDDGYPIFMHHGTLPISVISSARGDNELYTISEYGVGLLDLGYDVPRMDEYGGYGGHLIAFGDSALATSDGTAVHLYSFKGASGTSSEQENELFATAGGLRQNYPNPFNPRTRIDFELLEAARVEISIFDLLGRKVVDLIDAPVSAGFHTIEWNGTNRYGKRVASGVYFCRMTTPVTSETRKMVLLK